jgi:hypothetical protein
MAHYRFQGIKGGYYETSKERFGGGYLGGVQAADLPTKISPVEYLRAPRPCVTSKKSK